MNRNETDIQSYTELKNTCVKWTKLMGYIGNWREMQNQNGNLSIDQITKYNTKQFAS